MPDRTRARRTPALVLLAVVASTVALVATTLGTPATAAPPAARADTSSAAKATVKHDRAWKASRALRKVEMVFDKDTPAAEMPNATMALRNLVLYKDALSPAERKLADQYTRRPDLGANERSGGCPPNRCEGETAALGDANIVLHYDPSEVAYDINQAWALTQYVANTYAASGYRRPKPDGTKGGDARTDIYLTNFDNPSLYGYCTIDKAPRGPRYDVPAYCVLDTDYAGFPRTPIENFAVTIAHEYYHATQFAYDVADDSWFLEATATWAEDEMFTNINDNLQYLRNSPITKPRRPMDKFEDNGTFHYGDWIFFRYLTERFPARTGALPTLLLKMWEYADSSKGPRKDLYSVQAINKALKKVARTTLAEQFANFSASTRYPAVFSEGVANGYPAKRLSGGAVLKKGKKKSFKAVLDHLTSATYQLVPGGNTKRLKLRFKMAPKSHGSRAVVVVLGAGGAILDTKTVKVNRRGVAAKKVAFSAGTVSAVEVTLVNASTKYKNCYRFPNNPVSCSGRAVFDNQRAILRAKAS